MSSIGSNYTELTSYTLPNITAGNRIVNRGTYNIRWTGNKAQAAAENEGNFIDNYGTVSIVMNQTPNFGAENASPMAYITTLSLPGKSISGIWTARMPRG